MRSNALTGAPGSPPPFPLPGGGVVRNYEPMSRGWGVRRVLGRGRMEDTALVAKPTGTEPESGESSTQRSGIDNHKTKGWVVMLKELKHIVIMMVASVTIGAAVVFLAYLIMPFLLDMNWNYRQEEASTPNLYELTRQTAENTRHIFWLLVVGFVCLFGFYMPMLIRKNKAT